MAVLRGSRPEALGRRVTPALASPVSGAPFTRAVAAHREAKPGGPVPEACPGGDDDFPWYVGPLEAFAAPRQGRADAVALGGDLRGPRRPADGVDVSPSESDPTLDDATVSLIWPDIDRDTEVKAQGGAWLLGLDATLAAFDVSVLLTDSLGRARAWLLLPPPDSMIGGGHFWLPAVRPYPADGFHLRDIR
jgi:hypothetical protein